MHMKHFFLTSFLLLFCAGIWAANVTPAQPQCCFLENPSGISAPSFGWQLKAEVPGALQGAYEIQVASSKRKLLSGKADVWTSGKVASDTQFGIRPDGAALEPAHTYWWRVRIWDADGKKSSWTDPASFQAALTDEAWTADWITYDWEKAQRMPIFRKEITVGSGVERATAFVCGLGAADLLVNGSFADPTRVLDPAQTNYEHYALFSAIDVTGLLKSGSNCLGVMLYDGWFNQNTVFADFSYGKPMLRLQLLVEYRNGRTETFVTDESWQWKEGPVVKANIYSGEVYDARYASEGWALAGASKEGWQPCRKAVENMPPALRPQIIPAIRLQETLPAVRMWKTEEGSWVYDFGTNNTAEIHVRVSLPEGTRLTVRTGEECFGEGKGVDFRSTGTEVVPVQTDEYICAGKGLEEWNPRGTYHGFRYAELTCSDPSLTPSQDWLQAVLVHTDLKKTATFSCSEPQLNRLHEMALRTVQGNIVGVPMDCPTREKCGWLGDAHAYIKMAMVGYDMDNFLCKYMDDIVSGASIELKNTLFHKYKNSYFYFTDKASGIPFMIAPGKRLCGVASPDWGTAVVQLPWHMYLYSGNTAALEEYYGSMVQWTDYLTSIAIDHIVYTGLGDWCAMSANVPAVELTSTAFHYYDLSIMEQVAGVLGKAEDEARFASERKAVREAFIKKFYNPFIKSFGGQTADAMALDLGLCPEGEEKDVAAAANMHMDRAKHFFNCGIFGLCRIGSALSRNGRAAAVYKAFTKKGINSFEWMWKEYDATTLWESLPVASPSYFASHCHPMQAGFDIYFYEDIAGIRPVAEAPGYRKVLFDTCAWDIELESADASVQTRYGTVSSSWKKAGESLSWTVSVPAGSTGVIALPESAAVQPYPVCAREDGKVYYELAGADTYSFTVEMPKPAKK